MDARVGVVARSDKELGAGLQELRQVLAERGIDNPLWRELPPGSDVGEAAREMREAGVVLMFAWGGDGTVQRCVDAVAGSDVAIAIMPAGGGNLLARGLGIPIDIPQAAAIALTGDRRRIDVGLANDEHFTTVAGFGLASLIMRDHGRKNLQERTMRALHLGLGATRLLLRPVHGRVSVDGRDIYDGLITCVLVSNMAIAVSGVEEFEGAREDDGIGEIGIVGHRPAWSWLSTLGRVLAGRSEPSPFDVTMRGSRVQMTFARPVDLDLDGSAKEPVRSPTVTIRSSTVRVCVPRTTTARSA